jgi:hypothetical protein
VVRRLRKLLPAACSKVEGFAGEGQKRQRRQQSADQPFSTLPPFHLRSLNNSGKPQKRELALRRVFNRNLKSIGLLDAIAYMFQPKQVSFFTVHCCK